MCQIVIMALKRFEICIHIFFIGFQTNEISYTKSALKCHFAVKYFSFKNLIVFGAYLVISVHNLKCICGLHFELHKKT